MGGAQNRRDNLLSLIPGNLKLLPSTRGYAGHMNTSTKSLLIGAGVIVAGATGGYAVAHLAGQPSTAATQTPTATSAPTTQATTSTGYQQPQSAVS